MALDRVYRLLASIKVGPDNLDIPAVAQAIGQAIKDGHLSALNHVLQGIVPGSRIVLREYVEIQNVTTVPARPTAAVRIYANNTGTPAVRARFPTGTDQLIASQ